MSGETGANLVHIQLLDLADQILERTGRQRPGLLKDADTIAESHNGRNRLNLEMRRELRAILGAYLPEGDIGVLFGSLFVNRAECTAGSAPARPEVQQHDAFVYGLVEVLSGDSNGCHGSPQICWKSRYLQRGGGRRYSHEIARIYMSAPHSRSLFLFGVPIR